MSIGKTETNWLTKFKMLILAVLYLMHNVENEKPGRNIRALSYML